MAEASLAFQGVGLFTSLIGQAQQRKTAAAQEAIRQQQFAFREAVLRNQQIAIDQDKQAEAEQERLRQQLLGEAGAKRRGEIRVSQAGLGQLVDVGSALDITADLAGEVAFKKLISTRDSQLRLRNLEIEKGNKEAEIGLLGLESEQSALGASAFQTASRIQSFSTILSAGSTITRRFRFGGTDGASFRTN